MSMIQRLKSQHDGMLPKGEYAFVTKKEIAELMVEIESIVKDRDDARWRLCKVVGDQRGVWGDEIAKENGWDYLATEDKT